MTKDISALQAQPSPLRWWILAVVLIGTLLGTINNSIANVALPEILDDFGRNVGSGVWVITSYVLAFSVFMPIFGRLGDMYGHRRIYLGCLIGYMVMAVFCTLAPSVEALIVARALQGIAIAPVLPAVMSIVAATFPTSERGRAMGLWATINGLGLSIGPPLGGFLTSALGWRAVFWATIPIAAIAYFAALKLVPSDAERSRERFDWLGASALVGMMVCLMSSVTFIGELGVGSLLTMATVLATAGLFVAFLVLETTVKPPFVDLSLFHIRPYVAATAVASLQVFCLGGTLLLVPLFVVRAQGNDAAHAGVLLFFLPATMMAFANVAGRANDRYGSKPPVIVGLFVIAAAAVGLSFVESSVSSVYVVACLVAMGVGIALVQSPAAAAVTYVIEPDRIGVAVGFFNMFRFVGSAFATTIFGIALQAIAYYAETTQGSPPEQALALAFRGSFLCMVAVALVAILIATRIVGRPSVERAA